MISQLFKITLNSDCIIKSISATEGVPESLSYIPGSVILGIVANSYDKFKNPFDIFHSGKVKFSNALVSIEDKPSIKVPLSWHYPKDAEKSEKIINAHLVKDYDELEEKLDNKQPKQMREEFVDIEFKRLYVPDFNFQLKSAYDSKLRRSKDSSMFAYEMLKKGTEYIFEVKLDSAMKETEDFSLIKNILKGNHYIGKSKTAQFGNITVSPFELKVNNKSFDSVFDAVFSLQFDEQTGNGVNENKGLLFLYAKSDVVLNNEAGFNTANIDSPEIFGIKSGRILHNNKTYLDFRKFNMYNLAVGRRLPLRTAINAGSVICIEGIENNEWEVLINKKVLFVGNYISEGFGEIYINPPFLFKKEFNGLNKNKDNADRKALETNNHIYLKDEKILDEIKNREELILQYIDSELNKETIKDNSLRLAEEIFKSKDKFASISKSQWGRIRTIAKQNRDNNESIVDEIKKYTGHGVSYNKWEDSGARKTLIDKLNQYKNDKMYDLAIVVEYLAKLLSVNRN